MRLSTYLRFLGLAFALLVIPAFAAAQQSVTCESNDGNRQYCGNYNYNQVSLQRQISQSPCVQGQTWGVDGSGLWVDRGCRAIFTVGGNWNGGPGGPGGPGGGQNSVNCESNDGRRNYCADVNNINQVSLDRQVSQSPCVRGRTWGVDRRGLWVDRGCRGIFTVNRWNGGGGPGPGPGPGPGGPGGGWWDPNPNDPWPPSGNWNGGNWGRGGACFYTDRGFGGRYFCLRRGERRDSLGSYGDNISSIRVFGGARVTIFDDRNFHGARDSSFRDVPDLREWGVSQKSGHTWNNRISSLRVQ
jgi:hypothetical protein